MKVFEHTTGGKTPKRGKRGKKRSARSDLEVQLKTPGNTVTSIGLVHNSGDLSRVEIRHSEHTTYIS